jgi:hypothetical protein
MSHTFRPRPSSGLPIRAVYYSRLRPVSFLSPSLTGKLHTKVTVQLGGQRSATQHRDAASMSCWIPLELWRLVWRRGPGNGQ